MDRVGMSGAAVDERYDVSRRRLVATGPVDELPDIPGVAERWGTDVLHCPYCHGWEVRDRAIGILGDGPLAARQALMWRRWSGDVTLFRHRAQEPSADEREELSARGIPVVEGVVPRQAVVVAPRVTARTGLLARLGLERVPLEMNGHVVGTARPADPTGATAVPGGWVAGNVTDLRAQVVCSAAAGLDTAAMINADLIAEGTRRAVDDARRVMA
jgi:thioredoxin reductase